MAEIEQIVAFLDEQGGGLLRDMIASGQFIPNAPKWLSTMDAIAVARAARGGGATRVAVSATPARQNVEPLQATGELAVSICDSQPWREMAAGAAGHQSDLVSFLRQKWLRITSEHRHFGFDPERTYPVEVAAPMCRSALGLTWIEFDSNGHISPGIGVNMSVLGVTIAGRLDSGGNLHLTADHPELTSIYRLLLNLAVVLHYFDLVFRCEPASTQACVSGRSGPVDVRDSTNKASVRTIPRSWKPDSHESVEKSHRGEMTEHFVDPFRRRLPPGQTPSFAKIVEADQFGINLQGPGYPKVQYTFVREHTRGGSERILGRTYRHTYQAARTLDSILIILTRA